MLSSTKWSSGMITANTPLTFFTNWNYDATTFPYPYGSGIIIPTGNIYKFILYFATSGNTYTGIYNTSTSTYGTWKKITVS